MSQQPNPYRSPPVPALPVESDSTYEYKIDSEPKPRTLRGLVSQWIGAIICAFAGSIIGTVALVALAGMFPFLVPIHPGLGTVLGGIIGARIGYQLCLCFETETELEP